MCILLPPEPEEPGNRKDGNDNSGIPRSQLPCMLDIVPYSTYPDHLFYSPHSPSHITGIDGVFRENNLGGLSEARLLHALIALLCIYDLARPKCILVPLFQSPTRNASSRVQVSLR